jgi:hypothetical protein
LPITLGRVTALHVEVTNSKERTRKQHFFMRSMVIGTKDFWQSRSAEMNKIIG